MGRACQLVQLGRHSLATQHWRLTSFSARQSDLDAHHEQQARPSLRRASSKRHWYPYQHHDSTIKRKASTYLSANKTLKRGSSEEIRNASEDQLPKHENLGVPGIVTRKNEWLEQEHQHNPRSVLPVEAAHHSINPTQREPPIPLIRLLTTNQPGIDRIIQISTNLIILYALRINIQNTGDWLIHDWPLIV